MDGNDQSLLTHLWAVYMSDLTYRDFYIPGAFVLWSMQLIINLKVIDSTHLITAATYVVFCVGVGVLQVIALPSLFHERFTTLVNGLLILMFATLASARWYRFRHHQQVRMRPRNDKDTARGK